MSDLENDSRTTAVGRKRKYEQHTLITDTNHRRPSNGSKESGEISNEDDSDSDIEEISADQWTKKRKTSTSSSSDSHDSSIQELPRKEGDVIRLLDISREDQKQQAKYFNLRAMSEPVRCLCCGVRGHMATDCATRTCSHCHKRDLHPSNACPTWRKCRLCRERGHDAGTCRNRSFRGADPCDVCQKTGHVEVKCFNPSHVCLTLTTCRRNVRVCGLFSNSYPNQRK